MARQRLEHLSPRHRQAAKLLGAGWTQQQTARVLGVGERTVRFWLRHDALGPKLRNAVRSRRIQALGAALDTLEGLLRDPNPFVQIQAARLVFGLYRATTPIIGSDDVDLELVNPRIIDIEVRRLQRMAERQVA